MNRLSFNKQAPFAIFVFIGSLTGCQPQMMDEPLPERFGLDNVNILVQQKILLPEKLEASPQDFQYKAGAIDLNLDGRDEIMVLMQGSYFCGSGGCTAYLFNDEGEQLNRMTVVREPVLVSERRSNGWKDFYVWSEESLRTMSYDGVSYPKNPSLAPKYERHLEQKAARQLAEIQEIYVQDGYDLALVDEVPLFYPVHSYPFQFKHYGDPKSEYKLTVNMLTGHLDLETFDISEKKPLR
ncbi:hypothetical protein [Vibrio methylphosphonaticus]|uniref:hypothetical protein n=1 Tax=Vibrio methylphosphonaticus TaxID=2946866 RepID=UPI00202A32FE|nr:hypothetical protein [Vibrio methylphosphonaticus]MCL9773652.1 hypothetical protein [Vibrio methylphosphonaticus]